IPFQKEVGILSGTDATYIQIVEKGIPVGVVSIPLRYMHTPVEVVDPQDVEKTINLLSLFIQEVDASFLEALYGEY
ncbi:MAG: M42 family peptidase, partial [Caldiserica bacterium]|nr:M42 family peptidase [Caldisericota bacterium]